MELWKWNRLFGLNLLLLKLKTKNTVHILFMDPTILFTHFKIILLQCFQFSVLTTINSIQMDP